MIRPYKGLGDAIEATLARRRRAAARRGRPGSSRSTPTAPRPGDRAEWRLGYLPDAELDRALGEATVALFPYRAELDQSGALLRALGAGVPAVVYDVGGLAEPVQRVRRRAASCPPGTSRRWRAALAGCSATAPRSSGRARAPAGPRRADVGRRAAAHLALYRELA